MLIVTSDGSQAVNPMNFDCIKALGDKIICESGDKLFVLARYESEARAKEIFEDMLEDFARSNEIPFDGSISPYWLPEK